MTTPSPIILPLEPGDTHDLEPGRLETVGGKALNLIRLAQASLPVPPGFVIAAEAYRAYVEANQLLPVIQHAIDAVDVDDPASLEVTSQTIRAAFAQGELAAALEDELLASYHELGAIPVAVRSSATAEDLPDLSFAGQQDTFLNVLGPAALMQAVVGCWSSLWTARAIAYRARNDISHDDACMGVIVQAMVPSEASGVLFTANPVTGCRTEVVINAALGLGEGLVSGQVDPDHYVVDMLSMDAIVSKVLGAKATAVFPLQGGGTVVTPLDAAQQQALSDDTILWLARLGAQVAALYGDQPQDIEWAWADGRLHLLQTRPITSLYPVPAGMSQEPLQVLFSLNAVQGMLDPFTPMGQDALLRAYVALARLFGKDFKPEAQREVWVAAGRLYLNVTRLLHHPLGRKLAVGIVGAIEPGSSQALETLLADPRLAPGKARLSLRAIGQLLRFVIPMDARVVLAYQQPDRQRLRTQLGIEALLAELADRSGQATMLSQRLDVWQSAYRHFAERAFPLLFPPLVAGISSFLLLRRLALRRLGSDQLAMEVARGLPHNVTTEMDLALWQVAQIVYDDPDSLTRFVGTSIGALADELQQGRLPYPAQVAVSAFLQRYGMRGLAEVDIGRSRWRNNPAPLLQALQSYLEILGGAPSGPPGPDVAFHRGAQAANTAVDELATAMGRSPLGLVRARLVRFLARRMRALAGLRELPKFTIVRMMDIVRADLLRTGQELVDAGLLSDPADVFFLHHRELESLAREAWQQSSGVPATARRGTERERVGTDPEWQHRVTQRQQLYERELRRRQIPRILLSDGTSFYEGMGAAALEDAAADHGVIVGSPVSPGLAEGLVRVVRDPHQARLDPGEILVCPGTDPSWTPLFLAAGGLVMEVGGLMTHGSVVAREYGIPAVAGVHQATSRLQTGQRIRVNGTTGQIAVLTGSE